MGVVLLLRRLLEMLHPILFYLRALFKSARSSWIHAERIWSLMMSINHLGVNLFSSKVV